MKILVVDDEPSILEVLRAFLEAGNANVVVTATSGVEALAIIDAAESDFDCLLLDIQMPVMNGIALCANIRENPDYLRVPIIMLTAMSQKPYIDQAFAVGATDYVTKPFDFVELRGRLMAAAKISMEYSRAMNSADEARRIALDANSENKPHPDEPISIDGIERVVGYNALENYLFTLSRTKLLFASTYAVAIDNFRALHESVTSREMRSILKMVAHATIDRSPKTGNIISYRGNGVFLCINQKKAAISPNQRKHQINAVLSNFTSSSSGKHEISVSVGQEISLVSFTRAGALVALRRAIDTLELPPVPIKDLTTMSKRALRGSSRTQEQSNLERRAYELALEDIMREEGRRAI